MSAADLREIVDEDADRIWRLGGANVKEAARFLGISSRSIYNLISTNQLPATRVGGRRLVSRQMLIDLLEAGRG